MPKDELQDKLGCPRPSLSIVHKPLSGKCLLHREILATRRRVLGPEYHDTLRSIGYVAAGELAQGNLGAAVLLASNWSLYA